jgi:hypothetical protein
MPMSIAGAAIAAAFSAGFFLAIRVLPVEV